MGRWAQRRRGGGGGGPDLTNYMVSAQVGGGGFFITLTYLRDITAGDFSLADFISSPSGASPTIINQGDSNQLELTTIVNASSDDEIQYTGDTPGIVTPQQLQYT